MEDTLMMAQGLRYNWADRSVTTLPGTQPVAEGPVCPVCHPLSWERRNDMSPVMLLPRACPDRFRRRKKEHRELG